MLYGTSVGEDGGGRSIVFFHSNGCVNVAADSCWGGSRFCARAMLWSFATGHHKSYRCDCIKVATVIPQTFPNFGAIIFRFKIVLFRFGAEIVLRLQFRLPWGVILSYFATHSLQIRCNGCINVPWCCSCVRNTLVFCSWACIGGAASTMMKVGR